MYEENKFERLPAYHNKSAIATTTTRESEKGGGKNGAFHARSRHAHQLVRKPAATGRPQSRLFIR